MKTFHAFCILLGILLLAAPVHAQNPTDAAFQPLPVDIINRSANREAAGTAIATDPEHAQTSLEDRIQVSVGKESNRAVLSFGDSFSNGTQWQLKVSSPWGDDADESDAATLDRLASGTQLSFGLNKAWLNLKSTDEPTLERVCEAAWVEVQKQMRARGATPDAVRPECNDILYDQIQDKEARYQVAKAYFGNNPRLFTTGIEIGAAHDTFKFLDAELAQVNTSKTGFEVGINATMLNIAKQWSLVASFERQRSYSNNKASQARICVPIENTPAERCFDGYLAPPRQSDSNVSALEWRWQSIESARAISVRASYDAEEKVTGINVPIFLFGKKGDAFRGGVKLGWRSDTDDLQAAVFVSTGFNLL